MQGAAPWAALLVAATLAAQAAAPASIGQVKVSRGTVQIVRGGQTLAATVGTGVLASDRIVTGSDGSVGITFDDNSVLSTGPDSVLEISTFRFDTTTHEGAFESRLEQGTLSAISGKIARQTPEAMKVKTPSAILGVRGTEFFVKVDPGAGADASR